MVDNSNSQSFNHKEIKDYLLSVLTNINRSDFERTMNEMLFRASSVRKIDKDLVVEWLKTIDFTAVRNPLAYLSKAFPNQFEKGDFDMQPIKKPTIESQSLLMFLRNNNIFVFPEDTIYIDVAMNALFDFGFSLKEVEEINNKVIEHMKGNGGGSSKDFISHFKNSNRLKNNADFWAKVEGEVTKEQAEWEYIMQGLEHNGLLIE